MSIPKSQPNPFAAGLMCRCPRCGQGKLFSEYLKLASRCSICALDLAFADSGDGPAIFVIFLVSPLVIVLAIIVGSLFTISPMIHLAIWIPTTLVLCLALLPPFKATMVALQYQNDAHEGREGPK